MGWCKSQNYTKLKTINNMDVLNTEVSFYANFSANPKNVRLLDFLTSTKYKSEVESIRSTSNKNRVDQLKRRLPAITPSGIFSNKRGADFLLKHSGLICIDIDAKDNAGVTDFNNLKEYIAVLDCVAYCGLSVSGKGFFVIIPIASTKKHKEHFEALKIDFAASGLKIDSACGDVSRLRFASYDGRPYINQFAKPYGRVICGKPKRRVSLNTEINHRLIALVEAIEESETDITGGYHTWFELACALAGTYGEAGRELFHRISIFYPGYEVDRTDTEYDKVLKAGYVEVTENTVFHIAKENGVILNDPAVDYD
jgi:hypothetical protein